MRLLRKKQARGEKTPLDDVPELFEDSVLTWACFTDCDHCRRRTDGANAITIAEISAWLEIHCVNDRETRIDILHGVIAMDRFWFGYVRAENDAKAEAAKAEAERKKRNGKPPGRNRRA